VSSFDLELREGEVMGLLGPNGAGKTTVFRMIAGLCRAERGRVELLGEDVTSWPLYRRAVAGLGYLPQVPTVFRGLSVRDNLVLVLEERGRPTEDADGILYAAGLSSLSSSPAETLSGGERRRLELARVLALRPRVLMLDEPFAGVDPVAVGDIQARLRSLAREGLGVLITDHAVREAMGVCDRVAILDEGSLVCVGPPAEVALNVKVRARYLGDGFEIGRS
jgi:lipopolysaccharide export system ATP-binding protein